MENFFYNDIFHLDLTELCEYNEWDFEEINSFPDGFTVEVQCSKFEPIDTISADKIVQEMNEDRFSEDYSDRERSEIIKILNENIDFEKINFLIPKLYYLTNKKHIFTKEDLLEAVS